MSVLEQVRKLQQSPASQMWKVVFLRTLTGPNPLAPQDPTQDVVVFKQGESYELKYLEAKHFLEQGLAEPGCEHSKSWCKSVGLTEAELLRRYQATSLLMDRGEIHTAEPASISEPA